jgi:hypothetical protein
MIKCFYCKKMFNEGEADEKCYFHVADVGLPTAYSSSCYWRCCGNEVGKWSGCCYNPRHLARLTTKTQATPDASRMNGRWWPSPIDLFWTYPRAGQNDNIVLTYSSKSRHCTATQKINKKYSKPYEKARHYSSTHAQQSLITDWKPQKFTARILCTNRIATATQLLQRLLLRGGTFFIDTARGRETLKTSFTI